MRKTFQSNKSSQNTLTISKMGINEVVETSCDLIEETNTDPKLWLVLNLSENIFSKSKDTG